MQFQICFPLQTFTNEIISKNNIVVSIVLPHSLKATAKSIREVLFEGYSKVSWIS